MQNAPFDRRLKAAAEAILSTAKEYSDARPAVQLFRPNQQSFYHYGFEYEGLQGKKGLSWPEGAKELQERVRAFILQRTGVEPDWDAASGLSPKTEFELPADLTRNTNESRRVLNAIHHFLDCAEKTTEQRAAFQRQLLVGIPQSLFYGSLRRAHKLVSGQASKAHAALDDFVDAAHADVAKDNTLALLAPLEEAAGMARSAGYSLILPVRTTRTKQFLGVIHYFRAEKIDEVPPFLQELHEGMSSVVVDAYEQDYHAAYDRFYQEYGGDCFLALGRAASQFFNVWLTVVLNKGDHGAGQQELLPTHVFGWPTLERPNGPEPILDTELMYNAQSFALHKSTKGPGWEATSGSQGLRVERTSENELKLWSSVQQDGVATELKLPQSDVKTILGQAGLEPLRTEDAEAQIEEISGIDPYRPRSIFRVDRDKASLVMVLATACPKERADREKLVKEIARAMFRAIHSQQPHSESTRLSAYQPAKVMPWEEIPLTPDNRARLEGHVAQFQHAPRIGIRESALTILLHGKPGTGKTYLARKLLNCVVGEEVEFMEFLQTFMQPDLSSEDKERGQTYLPKVKKNAIGGPIWLRLSVASTGSSYYSETERRLYLAIRGLVSYSKKNNCTVGILLDEVDQLSRRKSGQDNVGFDPTSTLQTELTEAENERLVVLATGNNPDNLEPALKDRFFSVAMSLPNQDQRVAMLEQVRNAEAPTWNIDEETRRKVAQALEGRAYRHISRLMRQAIAHRAQSAGSFTHLERVLTWRDFKTVLDELAMKQGISTDALERAQDCGLDFSDLAAWCLDLLEEVKRVAPKKQSELWPWANKDVLAFAKKQIDGLASILDQAFRRNNLESKGGTSSEQDHVLRPVAPSDRVEDPSAPRE